MYKDEEGKKRKVVTKTEIVSSDVLSPFYPRFKDLKMDISTPRASSAQSRKFGSARLTTHNNDVICAKLFKYP